jgi:hypothetical protein
MLESNCSVMESTKSFPNLLVLSKTSYTCLSGRFGKLKRVTKTSCVMERREYSLALDRVIYHRICITICAFISCKPYTIIMNFT